MKARSRPSMQSWQRGWDAGEDDLALHDNTSSISCMINRHNILFLWPGSHIESSLGTVVIVILGRHFVAIFLHRYLWPPIRACDGYILHHQTMCLLFLCVFCFHIESSLDHFLADSWEPSWGPVPVLSFPAHGIVV